MLEFIRTKIVFKNYELSIYSLSDTTDWIIPEYIPDEVVFPPIFKRTLGRAKMKNREK